METFSIGSAIRFGWETFKKRPWIFVGGLLCVIVASSVGSIVAGLFGEEGWGAIVGSLISFTVSILIGMGEAAFFLKAEHSPESVQIQDLWHPRPFWKYVGAAILVGLCVLAVILVVLLLAWLAGLFVLVGGSTALNALTAGLMIVAAAFVTIRLQFAQYAVIDKGFWPLHALKESVRITRGRFWQLVGLLLSLILINILGLICLVVGLLVSIPVTMLAIVHTYRTLSKHA